MKEFHLDLHDVNCSCGKESNKYSEFDYCALNPERFLFFVKTRFVLITYYRCLHFQDEYDFKKSLIDKIIKDNKVFEYYEIRRSVNVQAELRDFRIRNKSLRKHIQQVNYVYCNSAGKKFAITTLVSFVDAICNQEEIEENYKIAKQFLVQNEYDWLLESLEELYNSNCVYYNYEIEAHKTVEHLVNSINKLTK